MRRILIILGIALALFFVFRAKRVPTHTAPINHADNSTDDSGENADSSTDDSDEQEPQTFAGHECTIDCGGHRAGYNWAEEHDIDDEDVCDRAGDNSNSPSFAEGCKAYVDGESPNEDGGNQ